MTTSLVCVRPDLVPGLFHVAAPLLDKGYARADEVFPPETYERLLAGDWLLWLACEGTDILAAMITRLYVARSGKCCQILCCGGSRVAIWNHHMVEIEAYAKAEGCVKVIAEGRRGWLRVLDGFSSDWVKFEKVLT